MAEENSKNLLDDIEDVSLAIEAKFTISEIKMKSDWRWKVKMLIHKMLPKTHHDYNIKLIFDEEPYQMAIRQFEKEVGNLKDNPTLLPSVDKKEIKDMEKKMKKKFDEMKKARSECPDIEFTTQTEEIKYKDGDTSLLFKVLDTVIEPLNRQKYRLSEYKAILDPIYTETN